MDRRWRRILGALAAGAAVMLVLFLLTVFSEDRPLWGINPDLQLWAAGLIAGLAGILAYGGLDARSPSTLGIGACLGVAGFLVTVVGAMAIVASFPGPYASYEGWTIETDYEEPWNATVAREALEDQGFNVTRADDQGLLAYDRDAVRVFIDRPRASPGEAPEGFRLTVQIDRDGENVGSATAAREHAEDQRPEIEETYQAFLAAFEDHTGWAHDTEPRYEPMIAVS